MWARYNPYSNCILSLESPDLRTDAAPQASYDDIIPGAKLVVSGKLEGGKAVKDMAAPRISTEYRKDNMIATASVEGSSLAAGGVMEMGDIMVRARSCT